MSRFAACIIDITVGAGLFSLARAAISLGVDVVTGHQVSGDRSNIVVAIICFVWLGVYFAYSWAVSGRTYRRQRGHLRLGRPPKRPGSGSDRRPQLCPSPASADR